MDATRLSALITPTPYVLKTSRRFPNFTLRASTAQTTPPQSTSSTEKLKEFSSNITVANSLADLCGLEPPDDGLHKPQIGISSIRHEGNSPRPPEDVKEDTIKELEAATDKIMKDIKEAFAAKFAVEAAERIDDAFSIPGYDKNLVIADHVGVIPICNAAGIGMEDRLSGLPIIPYADLVEQQVLGCGAFATVYHGKWRGTDVAIKRFKKSHLAEDYLQKDRLTKTFRREAQILSKLRHPQVVAFYGVVPDGPGGTLAYVSEHMVDGSLRDALFVNGELDWCTKLMVLLDAAFGMEYLHSLDVVHFDLKGHNLLVNFGDPQRPACKVADFGLSIMKQNTLVSGGERGTLRWMAPELLIGRRNKVSDKVDVYSFGITIWETLTGEVPYGDMHPDIIRFGVVYFNLRPTIPEYCDPELRKLMEECWSPDPAARPSFTQIRERLQAMLMALQLEIQN